MKNLNRIILLVLFFAVIVETNAQVGINKDNTPAAPDAILHVKGSGGNHFFIHDISGNVGIGTLTPQERLHVIGNIKLESTSSGSLSDSLLVWSLADSTLKIINPSALNINSRAFSTISGITSNEPGDLDTDDFVFGSGQLNYAGPAETSRMFFDKSKSAFRAGSSNPFDWNTDSLGMYSAAFGTQTRASGDYSIAAGSQSKAVGDGSMAIGQVTEAQGENAVAFGSRTEATGDNSTAIGYFTEATGLAAQAIGYQTDAIADYATALGYYTTSSGEASFSAGHYSNASGDYAAALGTYTIASGTASFAAGASTHATGSYSIAIGNNNQATGIASAAFGENAQANADYAFAFGKSNTVNNHGGFAFGQGNIVDGNYSFALGRLNDINEANAFSFGNDNRNNGNSSFSLGSNLYADAYSHIVFGRYNEASAGVSPSTWVSSEPLFEIGNGTQSFARSTAFYIEKGGRVGIGTTDLAQEFTVEGIGVIMILEEEATNKKMEFSIGRIETDSTLFINSNSQMPVAIGTSSPADGYMLSVDGKMIAEEIRVQLSTAWPDYVFEKEYNLLPLNELEKEIQELGHLPGIPSAEEVESEGIHLGEMESRLMEKVEELTLHFIELDKRLKTLESEKKASQK